MGCNCKKNKVNIVKPVVIKPKPSNNNDNK